MKLDEVDKIRTAGPTRPFSPAGPCRPWSPYDMKICTVLKVELRISWDWVSYYIYILLGDKFFQLSLSPSRLVILVLPRCLLVLDVPKYPKNDSQSPCSRRVWTVKVISTSLGLPVYISSLKMVDTYWISLGSGRSIITVLSRWTLKLTNTCWKHYVI